MAFDPEGLGVLAYCNGFTFWHYRSEEDGVAAIKSGGYFNPAADVLRLGDLIVFQSNGDTSGIRRVSLIADDQVSTAPMG
jgi:hypothetical protein